MSISNFDSIAELQPTEARLQIFSNLDPVDLVRCSRVSKTWHAAANDYIVSFRVLDSIAELQPMEKILQIFSYLDPKDLVRCSCVSKTWNAAANDHMLWQNFLPVNEFPQDVSVNELFKTTSKLIPPGIPIREYIIDHGVSTNEELLLKIKKFAEGLRINQKAHFRCDFLFNPEYSFTAEIENRSILFKNQPGYTKTVIFTKYITNCPDTATLNIKFVKDEIGRNFLTLDMKAETSLKSRSFTDPTTTILTVNSILPQLKDVNTSMFYLNTQMALFGRTRQINLDIEERNTDAKICLICACTLLFLFLINFDSYPGVTK